MATETNKCGAPQQENVTVRRLVRWSVVVVIVALGIGVAVPALLLPRHANRPAPVALSPAVTSGPGVRAAPPTHTPPVATPATAAAVAVTPRLAGRELSSNESARVAAATALDWQRVETMREALSRDDTAEVLRLARMLIAAPDADVRAETVSILGWIGAPALPVLSSMLTDDSEGVAAAAFDQWTMAVNDIADETARSAMLVQGMLALSQEDALNAVVLMFSQLPEDIAIRSLVTVIASDNAAAAKIAREHYAFMTQAPWTNAKDAELWIQANAAK